MILPLTWTSLFTTGGWSLIGIEETETWNINSTTGFIYEKNHGSDAFFELSFFNDDFNSTKWYPYVSIIVSHCVIKLLAIIMADPGGVL